MIVETVAAVVMLVARTTVAVAAVVETVVAAVVVADVDMSSDNGKTTDKIKALGLRKLQRTVEHEDNPAIRGMVRKVVHLLQVEEIVSETL